MLLIFKGRVKVKRSEKKQIKKKREKRNKEKISMPSQYNLIK
jgi:hypothetical protein